MKVEKPNGLSANHARSQSKVELPKKDKKKAGGIKIGVLPINEDSDGALTDRGNIPI